MAQSLSKIYLHKDEYRRFLKKYEVPYDDPDGSGLGLIYLAIYFFNLCPRACLPGFAGRQALGYNTIPFQGINILITEHAKRVHSSAV